MAFLYFYYILLLEASHYVYTTLKGGGLYKILHIRKWESLEAIFWIYLLQCIYNYFQYMLMGDVFQVSKTE